MDIDEYVEALLQSTVDMHMTPKFLCQRWARNLNFLRKFPNLWIVADFDAVDEDLLLDCILRSNLGFESQLYASDLLKFMPLRVIKDVVSTLALFSAV